MDIKRDVGVQQKRTWKTWEHCVIIELDRVIKKGAQRAGDDTSSEQWYSPTSKNSNPLGHVYCRHLVSQAVSADQG